LKHVLPHSEERTRRGIVFSQLADSAGKRDSRHTRNDVDKGIRRRLSTAWKCVFVIYGFLLAALALLMLPIAEDFSRFVLNHLYVFFGMLALPFAVFLVRQRSVVFRALGKRAV
jgi:hypothetical protein